MRTITSVPDAPAPRTYTIPARRAGTVAALLCRLRQRADKAQEHSAGDWRMRTVRQLIEHAERDLAIGRPDYAISNDLRTIDQHLTALERKVVTA